MIPVGFREAVLVHFTTSPDQPAKIQRPRKVDQVSGASHIAILETVTQVSGRRSLATAQMGTTDDIHLTNIDAVQPRSVL